MKSLYKCLVKSGSGNSLKKLVTVAATVYKLKLSKSAPSGSVDIIIIDYINILCLPFSSNSLIARLLEPPADLRYIPCVYRPIYKSVHYMICIILYHCFQYMSNSSLIQEVL